MRATIISMSSQIDALGQILGGPLVGAIDSQRAIPTALRDEPAAPQPSAPMYGLELHKPQLLELPPLLPQILESHGSASRGRQTGRPRSRSRGIA